MCTEVFPIFEDSKIKWNSIHRVRCNANARYRATTQIAHEITDLTVRVLDDVDSMRFTQSSPLWFTGVTHSSMSEEQFVGTATEDCKFYVNNGYCKYKDGCKHRHPANVQRVSPRQRKKSTFPHFNNDAAATDRNGATSSSWEVLPPDLHLLESSGPPSRGLSTAE